MGVRRIGALSLAKISAVFYGVLGLIIGAFISVFSLIGVAFAPENFVVSEAGMAGMLFGVAAVVVLPIFYGLMGVVVSLISAGLYNLVAGWVGGIELELQ